MATNPSQQLYEEYVTAMQEWEFALAAVQTHTIAGLVRFEEGLLLPQADPQSSQMIEVFDHAEKTKKAYLEKMTAYDALSKPYHQ
jgi:hypothetical protein